MVKRHRPQANLIHQQLSEVYIMDWTYLDHGLAEEAQGTNRQAAQMYETASAELTRVLWTLHTSWRGTSCDAVREQIARMIALLPQAQMYAQHAAAQIAAGNADALDAERRDRAAWEVEQRREEEERRARDAASPW